MPSSVDRCLLCQGSPFEFRLFAIVKGWRYVRCLNCGLVLLDPQPTPEELERFYNQIYRYDAGTYKKSVEKHPEWLRLLDEHCGRPGKLLEVGCSYGFFLSAARSQGWEVQGIELSQEAAQFARSDQGLPVISTLLPEARSELPASWDAIAAWHVLEHDPKPIEFISAAHSLLHRGGILAVRVPNLESSVAKMSGPSWQWLTPPEHVCMYTKSTLSSLLKRCGFEVLEVRTSKGNARNLWFEILRARAKSFLGRAGRLNNGAEQVPDFSPPTVYEGRLWYRGLERAIAIGTAPIDWLLSPWLAWRGKEAELVVVARKP
jgi:SAM-dependent methyltransferase